jgi:FAD-dependent monooxygenase
VLISSGLNEEKAITKWLHPSVEKYRKRILENNDGSLPLEPYQRISQAVFEAWLKTICDEDPLIDARFGWRIESVEETEVGATCIVSDVASGSKVMFKSNFVISCDGASSKVRRSLSIPLDGGPVYVLSIFLARSYTHQANCIHMLVQVT